MKLWKKHQKYFLIFLILLNINFSNCDDDCQNKCQKPAGSCDKIDPDDTFNCAVCKPVYSNNKCCSVGTSGYFSLDSNGNCIDNCLGDKIIDDTKECTYAPITGKFQLGDIYYSSDPSSSSSNTITCSNNICECSKFFYKETIYGKTNFHCFDLTDTTDITTLGSYKFYNYKTGEFFTTRCPDGLNIKKEDSIVNGVIRCSDKCLNDEFYLAFTTSGSSILSEYCVASCSGQTYESSYIYQYTDNGVKKCVNACPTGLKIKSGTCVTLDECNVYDGDNCYNSCSDTSSTTNKLYHNYESKECISGCTGGDFIYKKDPDDHICYKKENCNFIDESDSTNFKCRDTCITFHDYNSKKCISNCGQDDSNKLYHADSGDYQLICYSSCLDIPSRDYIYEEKDGGTNNYRKCFKTKPTGSGVCDKYYQKISGVRKCATQQDCLDLVYTYFIGDECKESCDGYYQLDMTSYIKCFKTLAKALDETNINFCDTSLKKCWTTFPTSEEYYIKSEFSIKPGKYELVKNCPNFYYEADDPIDTSTPTPRKWCTDKCTTTLNKFYVNGRKDCLADCHSVFKYYYDDNNECIDSCELRPTKPFSYQVSGTSPEKCRGACDDSSRSAYIYYNYNSHVCLSVCGEDNSINLYHKTGEHICYPSCLDIPPRGTFKYEIDQHECSSSNTCSDYYYKKSEGLYKCATQAECTSLNYKYLTGSECSNKCEENYYKLDGTPFIKCFSEPQLCLESGTGTVYYNEETKTCWTSVTTTFMENYFVESKTTNIYKLVNKCPKFYYINTGDNSYKYCTPACKIENGLNKYFISNEQKCEDNCDNDNFKKYYYDPSNNECLDTCKGRTGYGYQIDYTTSAIACLSGCTGSTLYYNFDSNICLAHCGGDGSNKKYHALDKYLCYASCAEIPGGDYLYELKGTNDYTCYTQDEYQSSSISTSNCPYYILKDDGTRMCKTANDCMNKNYNYLLDKECKKECDAYYKYEPESADILKLIQCFSSESECETKITGVKYFNKNLKKCWKTYPPEFYLKEESTSTSSMLEVLERCDDYYYEGSSTYAGHNICTRSCQSVGTGKFFIKGKNKCEDDCFTAFQKHYYNPVNKECLDTCKDLLIYKFEDKIINSDNDAEDILVQPCKEECNDYPYHDVDSNICIENCGDKYHADGEKICYASCAMIPGGQYIYEKDKVCYTSAPTGPNTCDNYYINTNGIKQCTTKEDCINKKYKYFIGDECKENCDGYYKFETQEGTAPNILKFTKCFEKLNDILSSDNVIFYNIKSKLCWNTFPKGYYIKEKKEIEIDSSTINKYELVEQCDFFYYEYSDTTLTIPDPNTNNIYFYHCTDNNKCKEITGTNSNGLFFIKGQKNCETSCTIFNKHYYNPDNNECLDTCKGLPNKEFAHKPTNANPDIQCIEKCNVDSATPPATTYYYDYDSNLCINKCGDDHENYLYKSSNTVNNMDKICYPSCNEIPNGNYKFESIADSDNIKICYTSIPTDCGYYYTKKDGTLKCLGTDITKCTNMKYNYLLGQECRNECNDFYILEDDDNTNGIKHCYEDETKCRTGTDPIYYSSKLKKCWKNYPTNYFISKVIDEGNPTPIRYEMVEECTYFYYYKIVNPITSKKNYYCTEKCTEHIYNSDDEFYFIQGRKNCETSCAIFSKFFYDSNYECLDTCIGLKDNEFADKNDAATQNQPQQCKSACSTTGKTNYNFGENLCFAETCVADLNKFIVNDNTRVCYNSCSEIPGRKNVYQSESGNICYTKAQIDDTNCLFYYPKNDGTGTMKCISSSSTCKQNNFNYVFGKECRENCDDFYKLMDESIDPDTNTIRCFENLYEALNYDYNNDNTKDIKFYNTELKQCWFRYPRNFFIKYENDGIYNVVEKCENYYYEEVIDQVNNIKYYYCVENCKKVNLFFKGGDNKCIQSCNKYYDPTNNECLDSCFQKDNLKYSYPLSTAPSPITPQKCLNKCPYYFETIKDGSGNILRYECIDTCLKDVNKYINTKTKECLSGCDSNEQYTFENFCYPKCEDPSLNYIDSGTNECVLSCPSILNKIINIHKDSQREIFLCKSSCKEEEFLLEDKCLKKCPSTHSYIGNNKICRRNEDKCNGDPNGEKYYPINEGIAGDTFLLYKCTDSCNKAIIDSTKQYLFYTTNEPNKCLSQCKSENPNYLLNEYECLNKCPEDFPFYDKYSNPTQPPNHWVCVSTNPCSGSTPYYLEGECATIDDCKNAQKKYIDSNKRCLPKCKKGEIKQKNAGDTYTCKPECFPDFEDIDENEEPECFSVCPEERNYIGKNNKCKRSCDEEDGINYYEITPAPSPDYKIFQCIDGCKDPYFYKAIDNGKQCYKDCTDTVNYPYLSKNENLCYDNCLRSTKYSFTTEDSTNSNKKICSDKCEGATNIFYGEDKVCRDKCSDLPGTNIIGLENKCVANCLIYSSAKYQLRGKCEEGCDASTDTTHNPPFIRYSPTDYICKAKCERNENIVKDEKECVSTCGFFRNALNTITNPTDYDEYECIESCFNIHKFYYENDRICITSCNPGDKAIQNINRCISNCDLLTDYVNNIKYYLVQKIVGDADIPYDMCILNCPEKKPYIDTDNSECVSQCPDTKKYYIKEFTHEEEDIRKKCLNDCPKDYPFYTIRENIDNNAIKYYECQAVCTGYIEPNQDVNIKAKLCLNDCPKDDYKYIIINETENKKYCYKQCPDYFKYHFENTGYLTNKYCYNKCPEDAPYHKNDETICYKLSELSNGYILYNEKKWVGDISDCPNGYKKTKVEDNTITNTIYICSDECLEEFGIYSTTYNTCVKNCESSSLVTGKNLINDENNKICVCQKLFYRDEITHEIFCYSNLIDKTCKEISSGDYPIPLKGTNECLKYCSNNRILNPSRDICYETGTECSSVGNNTHLEKIDGKQICDCAYKYYYEGDQKKCLGENDICPEGKKYYIIDTKECIGSCPSGYLTFNYYCLDECPKGSTKVGNTCSCGDKFWYKNSEGNYECLPGNCLDKFKLYTEDKQCVTTCKRTYYPIFYENKCYDKCDFFDNIEKMGINSPLADYKCDCASPWYYDYVDNEKIMKCPVKGTISECKEYTNLNLNYMIEETRQCVTDCPSTLTYQYSWNFECFESCESAENKYHNSLHIEKVDSSLECNCQNLWYKNPDDDTKKICYDKNVNECPPQPESPRSTRYRIFSTKECVDDINKCSENTFKFNMICYDKCPEFTLESKINDGNGDINICVCDKNYLWYKYEKNGNTYYVCGLDKCPELNIEDNFPRKNLLKNENQCVRSCRTDGPDNNEYLYSFRNKCEIECPIKTEKNANDDECLFIDIEDINKVDDLEKLKEATNIQSKELYENSNSYSGYIMHNFDASLQIYALNKLDSHKELAMQSNLTYIDLGTCLNKIYADKNLEDTDNILITKYDLLARTHKVNPNNDDGNDGNAGAGNNDDEPNLVQTLFDENYLINQVEYEFYLEKNNQKIEGSICSPYEIEISYPIFYNKNKFNNYQLGQNSNNYLKQFMIGKDLHSKNSEIDTFNKDNKVYKDICIGVEINGKDLILEERYNYLYPNNVSLCESNCTMKNTDFDLQRINCMCTYKEIMDFKRLDEDINDILNNPDFDRPTQSSANAQIIKCLSKIGIKEGLINNEAFYFCAVGSVIIVSMAFVSAFTGVKYVANFVSGMLKMKGGNNVKNFKNNNNAINSSNRIINNPPKKGDINDTSENNINNNDNDKGNIVIKKNIKLNYNIKNDIDNNNLSELSINKDTSNINKNVNYGLNIKSPFPKNKKNIKNTENKNNISQYNTMNEYPNKKAEFIPPEYNFKFFKPGDKAVIKKLTRNEIPFEVDKDTKILLEGKNDIYYDENYLNGPFYEEQNIIEIIDDNNDSNKKNNDNNVNNKNNKVVKFSGDINNKNTRKNNSKIDINDISIKQDNDFLNKKNDINNINSTDKQFIKIKRINPINNIQIAVEDYKTDDEIKEVDSTTSIYNLMKREHTYLRVTYEKYISKNHPNILATFLAEILDKIYLIKIFIFLKKFEILSIHLSLYIFYHIILLSLLCGFFTKNVIKKIWEESNYPTINFYLLYGLISHIIIWVIYKIFILVLDNQDKIRSFIKLNNDVEPSREITEENHINYQKEQVNEKYEDLIKKIKIQTGMFYLVVIALTVFCFIYLVSFFAIYTGTKDKVFKAYYISLIEILLIKFVYGLCLGSLRIAADGNELKSLYNFVYALDKYIS